MVLNDVTLTSGMTTFMQLGGKHAGASDRIILEGGTTLDGALNVALLASFAPHKGDMFDLFDGTMNGTFQAVNLPELRHGLAWDTTRLYTDGTVTVVPEPVSLVAGLVGLACIGGYLKRRLICL